MGAEAERIDDDLALDIPLSHKQPARRALSESFATQGERAILVAYVDHGYRLYGSPRCAAFTTRQPPAQTLLAFSA